MFKIDEEINKRYGYLIVLEYVATIKYFPIVLVKCDCGTIKQVRLYYLKSKSVISCGCYNKKRLGDQRRIHGCSGGKHPLYGLWQAIKERCLNKKFEQYRDYGGRGITVCDQWLNNFQAFYDWCIENGWKKGLDIDRRENEGHYEPGNCRFVTRSINCNNKRNNRRLYHIGETKTLTEWCQVYDINLKVVQRRLGLGWTTERALTEKPRVVNKIA